MSVVAAQTATSLTVGGPYFTSTAAVYFNGRVRPTQLNNQGQLNAQLTMQDVAAAGPVNQGGISSPLTLTIVAPPIDAVSYQISNGHNGFITFNSPSFPASARWSVDLGPTILLAHRRRNRVCCGEHQRKRPTSVLTANGAAPRPIPRRRPQPAPEPDRRPSARSPECRALPTRVRRSLRAAPCVSANVPRPFP